jgi:Mg-chelatase subunit ChlD
MRTAPAKTHAPIATAAPRPQLPMTGAGSPENMAIAPQLSGSDAASLEVDWEQVMLGTNRSCAPIVSSPDGAAVSVTLSQAMYRRTSNGDRIARLGPVPPAPRGTEGSLTARNQASGESVTYVWRWDTSVGGGTTAPAQSKGSFLTRLLSKARTASPEKTARAVAQPSVAQRLGSRAPLAVTLKFFGQETSGQRFAFILDRSGSMDGARWKACRQQLESALRKMPEHAEFLVVLFSTRVFEPPGQSSWMRATTANVSGVIAWVNRLHPGGGTEPLPAFQRVFRDSAVPDVIYFLTDGDIAPFSPGACARLRDSHHTIVNAVALENSASAEALTEMATASGGQYILIPNAEQAATHE